MHITQGKVHEYLGMMLDFSVKGKVKITMIPYIKEIIESFIEEIRGMAAMLAGPIALYGVNREWARAQQNVGQAWAQRQGLSTRWRYSYSLRNMKMSMRPG